MRERVRREVRERVIGGGGAMVVARGEAFGGGRGVGKGKRRGIRVFYIGEKWGDELVSVCIYVYV